MMWLLLLMLFTGAMLLFVVAFVLSLMRIARRQYSMRRTGSRSNPDHLLRIPGEPRRPGCPWVRRGRGNPTRTRICLRWVGGSNEFGIA